MLGGAERLDQIEVDCGRSFIKIRFDSYQSRCHVRR